MNCKEPKNPEIDDRAEEIAKLTIDAAIRVHRELGPGLLESVYQYCLVYELTQIGIPVQSEVPISIRYRNLNFDAAFRADLILDDRILIELKAVEILLPVHKAQIITYLKLACLPLGLLINFNVSLLKDGLHRIIHPSLLRDS
ncbi:MAG: GxxExxY protein [Opitutaceae bacterium]